MNYPKEFAEGDPDIIAKWLFRYSRGYYMSNARPHRADEIMPPTDGIAPVSMEEFAKSAQKNIANWIRFERQAAKEKYENHRS